MAREVSAGALKRKRSKGLEKPQKRAKSESSSDDDNTEADILLLENEILESRKNYNNITVLLELAQNIQDGDGALIATVSLCRVFLRLLASGALTRQAGQSEKDIVVVQWLKSRLSDYKKVVLTALAEEEIAPTALTLAMRMLKAEGQYLKSREEYSFPKAFLKEIIKVLITAASDDVREEYCEKFVGEYCDVRFYTFEALKGILSEEQATETIEDVFESALEILAYFEDVPDSAEDLSQYYIDAPKKRGHALSSLTQHKRQGQEAWLALLKLGPNRDQRKQVLEIMTRSIVPWFAKPELLADFLTDSYNTGGSMSLLALSGVFYLIQHRNLDYPSFYQKLYSLLDADILHSRHRSRFLRLMDTFLASTHLPAVLVASFIKRLSRLCLNAPPAAIVAVIPWIYNMFKQHPLCTFMIHRETRTQEDKQSMEDGGLNDPFVADEQDPMKTHAIDSCLWEVVQLQSHYHPNVATITKIISEQFTKQSYNMEDFLDHSYSSVRQICRGSTPEIPMSLTV